MLPILESPIMRLHPINQWFGPKSFGWGWTPVTWEGWVVVIGIVAVIAVVSHRFRPAG
jgi:hypothetical protein